RAARRRTGQARGEQPGDGEEPERENRIHAPYVRARLTPAQGQAAHPRCDEHKRKPAAESKTAGKSRSFAPAALRMTRSLASGREERETTLPPHSPKPQRRCHPERARGTRASEGPACGP